MHPNFISLLESFNTLSESEIKIVAEKFKPVTYSKGENILEEGTICKHLTFIVSGYCRVFVLKDIDENTVHIARDNDFIAAYSSFISMTPSHEFVQAITDVEALMISKEDLEEIYKSSGQIERLGRLILEHLFVKKENRVIDFIRFGAQERYNQLLENDPDILFNVPLQYIASYLGIKPETLSRIRAKKD